MSQGEIQGPWISPSLIHYRLYHPVYFEFLADQGEWFSCGNSGEFKTTESGPRAGCKILSNTRKDWELVLHNMADDFEQQEDELLALASIYDERIFIQSSEEKGGQFNVFLELPKSFKLKIQSRYLPRGNKSRTLERADGAEKTGSFELLAVEYLPPIVLNFRFPEDYPSKAPPLFTLSCKWLTVFQVSQIKRNSYIFVKAKSRHSFFFDFSLSYKSNFMFSVVY